MFCRVYIFGGPGSGKTTLAKRLSIETGYPCISMDEIMFHNGKKRDEWEMSRILKKEIKKKGAWIIEGGCLGWCDFLFKRVDLVVFLYVPKLIAIYRIIKRYIKERKFSFFSTLKLITKTMPKYYKDDIICYPKRAGAKKMIQFNTRKLSPEEIVVSLMRQ